MFVITFNTSSYAYNLPPLSYYYRSSLPTQMYDMGYEDEEEDDDNNNNKDDDDDDNDNGHDGDIHDHQQQQQ